MANDDDFTFCQVGQPDKQDYVDAQKIAQDISKIRIKDEPSNDAGTGQSNGAPWEGKLGSMATSKKPGTVGSLSFNVIGTSPSKQESGISGQVASKDGGFSVPTSQKQIKPARKPAARAKVPFEKGYSQVDWLKLMRTHPDLAGLKGQSNRRLISIDEVKEHQNAEAMWTVLKGHVYNITPYMKFHPGGVDMLMKAVGKDCTALFSILYASSSVFVVDKTHNGSRFNKNLTGSSYRICSRFTSSRIGYIQYMKSGFSSAIADGAPLLAILALGFTNTIYMLSPLYKLPLP